MIGVIDLLNFNIIWMTYNSLLAVIPVALGWLAFVVNNSKIKIILLILWLLFIPNTVYLFTDIIHFVEVLPGMDFVSIILLILQYSILLLIGLLTFVFSLYPIEKMMSSKNKIQSKLKKRQRSKSFIQENAALIIVMLNSLIGIGIVIGRIYRHNSWDVFFKMPEVIKSMFDMFTSPLMIFLAIFFSIFANFLYFFFKDRIISYSFKRI